MFRLTTLLSILILGFGCSGPARTADAPAEATVTVREGERAAVQAYDAILSFVRKTAESRCPTGLQCIRLGEAAILVSFTPDEGDEAVFTLETEPAPALDTLGYRFTLEALTPYPTAEVPLPAAPATATIRIEKTAP